MTKYKLNNTVRSSSEVTLTSYMGSTDSERKDERYYQMQLDSRDNDDRSDTNRTGNCHSCPDSCEFLEEPGKIAASLEKRYDKYSLNELKVENTGNTCLCEKYNGGCKLCPRPSLAPTLSLSMDGHLKDSCLACQGAACSSPNPSKYSFVLRFLCQFM
ncbi:unnamed protein product [Euphydryas editha]|uniref:Uncharacterized protein n=1 Tax=Euphydryas editha TaxID=104508 RepID=A0AAU9V723_EUPED|nr:unnamed protein product [Euphydryas editha]